MNTTLSVKLLLLSGLAHVMLGIGSIGVAVTEISTVLYIGKPAWHLPDALPNVSWVGHFGLLLLLGVYSFTIGITAVRLRYYVHRARLLLLISAAGLLAYVGFIAFSGYHEAYLRGGMWAFPVVIFAYVLYITGATLRFSAHKREVSSCS